jgi:hypothetical protein
MSRSGRPAIFAGSQAVGVIAGTGAVSSAAKDQIAPTGRAEGLKLTNAANLRYFAASARVSFT